MEVPDGAARRRCVVALAEQLELIGEAEHGLGPRAPPVEYAKVRVPEQLMLGSSVSPTPKAEVRPALRATREIPAEPRLPSRLRAIAEVRGINIHAAQVVDGRDRRRVERLCKYDPWKSPTGDITRPPVAQERLERRADGKLELSFRRSPRLA